MISRIVYLSHSLSCKLTVRTCFVSQRFICLGCLFQFWYHFCRTALAYQKATRWSRLSMNRRCKNSWELVQNIRNHSEQLWPLCQTWRVAWRQQWEPISLYLNLNSQLCKPKLPLLSRLSRYAWTSVITSSCFSLRWWWKTFHNDHLYASEWFPEFFFIKALWQNEADHDLTSWKWIHAVMDPAKNWKSETDGVSLAKSRAFKKWNVSLTHN